MRRFIKKKMFPILLAAVMVLGLFAITPLKAVYADDGPRIYATGIGYIYKNGSIQYSSKKISYNHKTNTLTLNNYKRKKGEIKAFGLGNFKVKLVGNSQLKEISHDWCIRSADNISKALPYHLNNKITFTGSGKLTLKGASNWGVYLQGDKNAKIIIDKKAKLNIKTSSQAMAVNQYGNTNRSVFTIRSGNRHSSGRMDRRKVRKDDFNRYTYTHYGWSKATFTSRGPEKSKPVSYNKKIKNKWMFGEWKQAHLKYNGKTFTMSGKWSCAKSIDKAVSGSKTARSLHFKKAGTVKTGYYMGSISYDKKAKLKKNSELVLNMLLVHVNKNGKIDKVITAD